MQSDGSGECTTMEWRHTPLGVLSENPLPTYQCIRMAPRKDVKIKMITPSSPRALLILTEQLLYYLSSTYRQKTLRI